MRKRKSHSCAGAVAPKPAKPSSSRISRKLTDKDGNLHFHAPAVQQDQQDQLEPKEAMGPGPPWL